jgi:hypothetical protein
MLAVSTRTLVLVLVACALFAGAGGVRADVSVGADSLALPGMDMTGMQADINSAPGGQGLQLTLSADRADIPAMGWRKLGVALNGALDRDELGRWVFDGALRLKGAPGGALSNARLHMVADESANTLELSVTQDKASARVALPIDQTTHAQITLKGLPAGWLNGLLSTVWSGRMTTGRVDADLALDLLDNGVQAGGQFALDGAGFDSPGGKLAGQKLSGSGRLGIDSHDRARCQPAGWRNFARSALRRVACTRRAAVAGHALGEGRPVDTTPAPD